MHLFQASLSGGTPSMTAQPIAQPQGRKARSYLHGAAASRCFAHTRSWPCWRGLALRLLFVFRFPASTGRQRNHIFNWPQLGGPSCLWIMVERPPGADRPPNAGLSGLSGRGGYAIWTLHTGDCVVSGRPRSGYLFLDGGAGCGVGSGGRPPARLPLPACGWLQLAHLWRTTLQLC